MSVVFATEMLVAFVPVCSSINPVEAVLTAPLPFRLPVPEVRRKTLAGAEIFALRVISLFAVVSPSSNEPTLPLPMLIGVLTVILFSALNKKLLIALGAVAMLTVLSP